MKIDEPSKSLNTPGKSLEFKTASALSSKRLFLLYIKLSSSLISTASFDDFLTCESTDSQTNKIITSLSRRVNHTYSWWSKPSQPSISSRFRSTSRSVSDIWCHRAKSQSFAPENFPSYLSELFSCCDLPLTLKLPSLFTYNLNLLVFDKTKNQTYFWVL